MTGCFVGHYPAWRTTGALPYKQAEFEVVRRLRNYSSLVPGAHTFGTSDDGSLCFMLLDFVEGTDGETALDGLATQDQYRLGVQAGRELKRLHAMPAPADLPDRSEAVSAKYARKAAAFGALGLHLPGIDRARLSRYIRENIPCIYGAGRTFLHGDHRPANLIVRDGRLNGIIDLNRYDRGDPVHDFLKTAFFTRAISIPFSVGQIDGYHEGAVPSPCSGKGMRCIAPWRSFPISSGCTIMPVKAVYRVIQGEGAAGLRRPRELYDGRSRLVPGL